jgi:nitrite reductase (NO-forming)
MNATASLGVATGLAVTLAAVVLAGSGGGTGPASTAASMAHATTETVDVRLANMRVRPGVIRVPAGTRLRLRVTNTDAMQHDLRLANGVHTPRLGKGGTATLDAGVVRKEIRGWCTVPGHRAAGMTMAIEVSGAAPGAGPLGGMETA